MNYFQKKSAIVNRFKNMNDKEIDRLFDFIFGNKEKDLIPIESTKTERHVEIIKPEDVIPCLLDDDKVIRVNIEKMTCCDIRDISIKTIKNDLQNDRYVYLVVDTYDIVNISNK